MIEFNRSSSANPHARSRELLFYYQKRSEYVLEYLAAVKAATAATYRANLGVYGELCDVVRAAAPADVI